jgi:hypothetical protein
MSGLRAVAVGLCVLASQSGVIAQEWQWLPGMTSAQLAHAGWLVTASAGFSWPDGRQAMITHWRVVIEGQEMTLQCFDYFDQNMSATGGNCKQAGDHWRPE